MSTRVAVNLVAFALLFAGLSWWALTNHVTFGVTTPDRDLVTFEFSSSPGLQPDFEVAYLGHPVGTIRGLELRDGSVVVTAGIDPDVEVPARVEASIRRRSAVGEPYIDLAPRDDDALAGPLLEDGDHLPMEHTHVSLSYQEVFSAASELLEALPVDDLGTIVSELAVALEGREPTMRELQADAHQALTSFAERSDLLDEVAVEATDLARLVADLATPLGEGLDHTALLTAELAAAEDELLELLAAAPGMLEQVTDLTVQTRPQLGCLLDSLGRSLGELDTPENERRIGNAVGRSDELIALLHDVTHDRSSGPWLRVDVILNMGQDPVRHYEEPLPHPTPPTVADCQPSSFERPPTLDEADTPAPPERLPGPSPLPNRPNPEIDAMAEETDPATPASTDRRFDAGPTWLWLALGALLLGALAAGARWLKTRGGGT
jgi:phospholipid/cholesterol/gamma-HCH transport system substrate-binding protein